MNVIFEVRTADVNKGLGLFAKRDLEVNEIILEEAPIVAAQFHWNETYGYLACHHCLRPMESTEENIKRLTNNKSICLPHPELCPTEQHFHRYCDDCGIGFCSDACKEISLKEYHKSVCAGSVPTLNKLIEEWKTIHYPPETTSIMLLIKIIGFVEQAEDPEKAVSTFLEFAHNSVSENEDMLMKFLGSGHLEKLQKIHSIIHEILPSPFVKNFLTEDGLKKLFALIGRNGQGIGSSVYSEWIKRVEKLELPIEDKNTLDGFINQVYEAMNEHVGTFLNCEGSGLYRLQRYINHSCTPNVTVTFPHSNSTLSLVCTRRIEQGEEICISYLDECMLNRSRHSRNKELRDYYLFDCKCEKCLQQTDELDVTSEEEIGSNEEEEESMEL